jgi:hypothetical protein
MFGSFRVPHCDLNHNITVCQSFDHIATQKARTAKNRYSSKFHLAAPILPIAD